MYRSGSLRFVVILSERCTENYHSGLFPLLFLDFISLNMYKIILYFGYISETVIRINTSHVALWDVSVETNRTFDCIIENSGYIYIYIYMCVCVCVCIYIYIIRIIYVYVCVYDADVNLRHACCETHSRHTCQHVIPPSAVLFNNTHLFWQQHSIFTANTFKVLVTVNFGLLLLSSSSPSPSSSSPLCRVFTLIFLR